MPIQSLTRTVCLAGAALFLACGQTLAKPTRASDVTQAAHIKAAGEAGTASMIKLAQVQMGDTNAPVAVPPCAFARRISRR